VTLTVSAYRMRKTTTTLFFIAILCGCSSQSQNPKIQAVVSNVSGHSHPISIRFADIERGQQVFVLEESAGHRHEIRLDAEKRALLMLQLPITVESSESQSHHHSVTIYIANE